MTPTRQPALESDSSDSECETPNSDLVDPSQPADLPEQTTVTPPSSHDNLISQPEQTGNGTPVVDSSIRQPRERKPPPWLKDYQRY